MSATHPDGIGAPDFWKFTARPNGGFAAEVDVVEAGTALDVVDDDDDVTGAVVEAGDEVDTDGIVLVVATADVVEVDGGWVVATDVVVAAPTGDTTTETSLVRVPPSNVSVSLPSATLTVALEVRVGVLEVVDTRSKMTCPSAWTEWRIEVERDHDSPTVTSTE